MLQESVQACAFDHECKYLGEGEFSPFVDVALGPYERHFHKLGRHAATSKPQNKPERHYSLIAVVVHKVCPMQSIYFAANRKCGEGSGESSSFHIIMFLFLV